MLLTSWVQNLLGARRRRARHNLRRRKDEFVQLFVTRLEERRVLSTFTVDNVVDESDGDVSSGEVSLREAIEAANDNTTAIGGMFGEPGSDLDGNPNDVIQFDSSLTGQTITLGGTQLPTITDDLTITGLGADQLTVTGNDLSRIFEIGNGVTVNIAGLTITGGNVSGDGGGLRNEGALAVTDSIISDNTATGDGGGLWNSSTGSVSLTRVTVAANSAGVDGGGIATEGGSLTLLDSIIGGETAGDGNTADSDGGGIFSVGAPLDITGGRISFNTATNGAGGGMANPETSTILISDAAITDNSALGLGGGIEASAVSDATITIQGGTISRNTGGFAGGIYLDGPITLDVAESTLSANESSGNGGAIAGVESTVIVTDSTIGGATAEKGNTASGFGGGIHMFGGTLQIEGTTIAHNRADAEGGGLALEAVSTTGQAAVANSTLSNNLSVFAAGGIWLPDPTYTLELNNVTITENRTTDFGGGLQIFDGDTGENVRLRNTLIAGNLAPNAADIDGAVVSDDFNLIGDTSGTTFVDGPGANDLLDVDPLLGPLQDNGGPTPTHALSSFSPAIDAGDNALAADPDGNPLFTDQRGFQRIVDGDNDSTATVDIGAFEFAVTVSEFSSDPLFDVLTDITTDGVSGFFLAGFDGLSDDGIDDQEIFRLDLTGGDTATVLAAAHNPTGITTDGTYLYWTDPNAFPPPSGGTALFRVPVGGGSVETIHQGSPFVDGSDLRFVDGSGGPGSGTLVHSDFVAGQLHKMTTGTSASPAVTGITQLNGDLFAGGFANEHRTFVDAEDDTVYAIDTGRSGVSDPRVLSIPLAGGTFTTLLTGTLGDFTPGGIAVANDTIFVTNGNEILQLPTTGGTPTLLSADPRFNSLRELEFFDGSLYAIDSRSGTDTVFQIDLTGGVSPPMNLDFGDAPDPLMATPGEYPTLGVHDGARHVIGGPRLGSAVDAEANGQPNATATGDDTDAQGDDEDGVTFLSTLVASSAESTVASVQIEAANTDLNTKLFGWIDFNGDGDWNDAGEQIFNNRAVVDGDNLLNVTVPAGAMAGETFARFRLSSDADLQPTGLASDGEIEDHLVTLADGDVGGINAQVGGLPENAQLRLSRFGGEIVVDQGGAEIFRAPAASAGSLTIDGTDGDDTLIVDFSGGNPIPGGGLTFAGGSQTTSGDALEITGGSFAKATYTFDNENDGSVDLDGSTITYTGLEPVMDNTDVVNRVFRFTGGAETITVSDSGGADGMMTIDSTLGESVTFQNPLESLTINAGTGNDTVNVDSVDAAYRASLSITGDEADDTVNVNAPLTLGSASSNGDLAVAAETIHVNSAIDTTAGATGNVALTAARNILMSSGASITTADGAVTLRANQAGTGSGSFVGIELNDTDISSQNGDILLEGRGGDVGDDNRGVFLRNGSTINSTGTGGSAGTVTLAGTGGDAVNRSIGVEITDSGSGVSSVDGDVVIAGTGGDATGFDSIGAVIFGGAVVESTGTAAVTLNGTGGTGTFDNAGIVLEGIDTLVSSLDGNLSLTGTGGTGTGEGNDGIEIAFGALVRSTGTASVTLDGTGGAGTDDNVGLLIEGSDAKVASANGAVNLTGTGGGGGTGSGNDGILIADGAVVESTATAPLTLTGQSGAGEDDNLGISIEEGGRVSSVDGAVSLTGTSFGSGDENTGISLESGAVLESTGSASLSLDGTGGSGLGQNAGIGLFDTDTRVTSAIGAVNLLGQGQGSGDDNGGIVIFDGAVLESTGTATLTLDGTGGPGGNDNAGIVVDGLGSRIRSVDGAVNMIGTGSGSGRDNAGIVVRLGGAIESTASATLTLDGTSSAGIDRNAGIAVLDVGSHISSAEGDILLTGTGAGSGGINAGVAVISGGLVQSTGNAALDIIGTTRGVLLGDGAVDGGTAPVTVTALAGSILEETTNTTPNIITAGAVALSAPEAIGGSGTDEEIDVADAPVLRLDANDDLTVRGNNQTLTSLTVTVDPNGPATYQLADFNGLVEDITTDGTDLTVANLDSTNPTTISLTAETGDVAVGSYRTAGAADLSLAAPLGNVLLGDGAVTTGSGTVSVSAAGDITDDGPGEGTSNENLSGSDINLQAGGNIGAAGTGGAVDVASTGVLNAAATGSDVFVNSESDLTVATIETAASQADTVNISTAGIANLTLTGSGGYTNIDSDHFVLTTETGTLTLQTTPLNVGSLEIFAAGGNVNITADVSTATGIDVDAGTGSIDVSGVLGGSGGLTKSGGGTMTLTAANTYTGATNINAGQLAVDGNIGATSVADTVSVAGGAVLSGGGDVNAPVEGQSGSTIRATGTFSLGVATDADGFRTDGTLLLGPHTLTLRDAGFSTVLGTSTTIAGGTLISETALSLSAGDLLSGFGTVDAQLLGFTGAIDVAGGNLTIGRSARSNLTIDGPVSVNGNALFLLGNDPAEFGGIVSLGSGGTIDSQNSTDPDRGIDLQDGARLQGSGFVATGTDILRVENGAVVTPGTSPGIINTNDLLFESGSTFDLDVEGTTPGAEHDQLVVTGTVTIDTAAPGVTLNIDDDSFSANPADQVILIDNDGSDPVGGTFAGLPEGDVLTLGGQTARITYAGGDGNDVALVVDGPVTFSAPAGGSTDLVLRLAGPNLQFVVDGVVENARPFAGVESVTVNGADDADDRLTIDFSGGNPIPSPSTGDVTFNGGTDANDSLVLDPTQDASFDTITHTFFDEGSGNIDLDGFVANYAGLEPIDDNLGANNRVFNFTSATNETIALSVSPDAKFDNRIDSTAGEQVDFNHPAETLLIQTEANGGSGSETVNLEGLAAGYDADLTVIGGSDDTVNFVANPTDIGTGNLAITADQVNVDQPVTTNGGTADLTAFSVLSFAATGSLGTDGGPITLTADDAAIDPAALINAGAETVTVRNASANRPIDLGSNTPGRLSLTDPELDTITAAALRIGRNNGTTAGSVFITDAIDPDGTDTLHILTGSTVDDGSSGTITENNLAVEAGGAVTFDNSNDVDTLAVDTSTGDVSFTDTTGGFTVGTVDGVSGVETGNGRVTLVSTDGDLIVANTAASNDVEATSTISVTLTLDEALFQVAAGANIRSIGDSHTYTADKMDLQGTIMAAAQPVVLQPNEAGEAIDLGSSTDSAADTLELADAELDRVTAGALRIGRNVPPNAAGPINVTAAIDPANTGTLHLLTGSTIDDGSTGSIDEANLALEASGPVTLDNTGNDADVFAAASDSPITYQDNAGDLTVGTVDGVVGITTSDDEVTLKSAGSLTLSELIDAGSATVTLTVDAGSISDGNAAANNVSAGKLNATATAGIATSSDRLETEVANLEADGGSGGLFIDNTGALVIGGVDPGVTGASVTGGDIAITAASPLTVDESVNNIGGGTITLRSANDGGDDDHLTVNAPVQASGGDGNILLDAGTDLILGAQVTAAGSGRVTGQAGRQIVDQNDALPDVVAENVELIAEAGIGPNSDGDSSVDDELEIDALKLAATTSTGDIRILDVADGLTIDNVGTTSGVSITAGGGGPDDEIVLTALSPLTVNEDVTNARGGDITLTAAGSTAADDLTIDANVTASGGDGRIVVHAGDEILQMSGTVQAAGTGTVDFNAGTGGITMQPGTAIRSDQGDVALTAAGDIELAVIAANSSDDPNSDATVRVVSNAAAILDNNDPSGITGNISGPNLLLMAATGIGISTSLPDPSNPLETAVNNLEADGGSGGLFIDNTGALVIGGVDPGVTGASATGGDIEITAFSPLTVDEAVTSTGGADITLTSTNDGGDDDHLTVNAPVQTSGGDGNVLLQAGTNLIFDAQVTAAGTGLVAGTAVAAIVDRNDTGPDIIAENVALTAGTGIATETETTLEDDFLEIDAVNLMASTVTNDIRIVDTTDGVALQDVTNEGAGTVRITSTAAIRNDSDPATNVTAANLVLKAATGIGTAANPLDTVVNNLEAKSRLEPGDGNFGIFINNTGNLIVGEVPDSDLTDANGDPVGLTTAGGEITISNLGTITVNEQVTNTGGGDINFTAAGSSNGSSSIQQGGAPFAGTLTNGPGDGTLEVGVDGFGSFGLAIGGTNTQDAFFDPVGPQGPTETTFESGMAIGFGGTRTFLTSGTVGSSGNLTNPAQTGTTMDVDSAFSFADLEFQLTQSLADLFEAGSQIGTVLTQVYTVTNVGQSPQVFDILRYLDGDLEFDGSLIDGGGRLPGPPEILFETDSATGAVDPTTFVGITAESGTAPAGNRFEIDEFPGLRSRIINGTSLDDIITGDGPDADQFIDAGQGFDVTLALRDSFSLAPGGQDTYTTRTIFGSGAPQSVSGEADIILNAPVRALGGHGNINLDAGRNIELNDFLSADGLATVTAHAGGSITDGNDPVSPNPAANNITAANLVMSAGTGIADADNPLETNVANLEAETDTGGVFLTNTGNLTIGGIAGVNFTDANGTPVVLTTNGGDIDVRVNSSLTVSETVTNTGGGDINLTAEDDLVLLNGPGAVDVLVTDGGTFRGRAGRFIRPSGIPAAALPVDPADRLPNLPVFQSTIGGTVESVARFVSPRVANPLTPQIDQEGNATLTVTLGLPGEENLLVAIDWGDGTPLNQPGESLFRVDAGINVFTHSYEQNPSANSAEPIPVKLITRYARPFEFFASNAPRKDVAPGPQVTLALGRPDPLNRDPVTGAPLAARDLAFTVVDLQFTVPGEGLAPTFFIIEAEVPPLFVRQPTMPNMVLAEPAPPPFAAESAELDTTVTPPPPADERIVFLYVLNPDGTVKTRPEGEGEAKYPLQEEVLENLAELFLKLGDGQYKVTVREPGETQERVVRQVIVLEGTIRTASETDESGQQEDDNKTDQPDDETKSDQPDNQKQKQSSTGRELDSDEVARLWERWVAPRQGRSDDRTAAGERLSDVPAQNDDLSQGEQSDNATRQPTTGEGNPSDNRSGDPGHPERGARKAAFPQSERNPVSPRNRVSDNEVMSASPASLAYPLIGGSVMLQGVVSVLAREDREERIDDAMERWASRRHHHGRFFGGAWGAARRFGHKKLSRDS